MKWFKKRRRLNSLKRILKVIEKDAEIQFKYVNDEGETCIIGGMAKEVGIKLEAPIYYTHPQSPDFGVTHLGISSKEDNKILIGLRNQLLRKYPQISLKELRELQRINDAFSDRQNRKDALTDQVNEWIESIND